MHIANEQPLDVAKRTFYHALLDDPTLTLLILRALDNCTATDLPNFTAEPWRPRSTDGTQVLGLRFTRSLDTQIGELGISLGAYSYLKVLVTSTEQTDGLLLKGENDELFVYGSDALKQLDVDDEMRRQAAMWFMLRWQEAYAQAFKMGAVIDPMTGTLTTHPE